jgi:predicted DNA-binding antitoxin AbrB/MazE fold protein
MNKTIHVVYEGGVFRPTETVGLPERSEVEFKLRLVPNKNAWPDGYFQQTAGAFVDEVLGRTSQGTLPNRDKWWCLTYLVPTFGSSISRIQTVACAHDNLAYRPFDLCNPASP